MTRGQKQRQGVLFDGEPFSPEKRVELLTKVIAKLKQEAASLRQERERLNRKLKKSGSAPASEPSMTRAEPDESLRQSRAASVAAGRLSPHERVALLSSLEAELKQQVASLRQDVERLDRQLNKSSSAGSQTESPLTRAEAYKFGRKVGVITGFVGYVSGALGAWALTNIVLIAQGVHPFRKSYHLHPHAPTVVSGAALGIVVTAVVTAVVVWKSDYSPRPFRVGAGGIGVGILGGVSAFLMVLATIIYFIVIIVGSALAAGLLVFVVFG